MNDPQLLQQFVSQASQPAFRQLVERHTHWLYSVCLRRLRDPALAEDATQAVFLALAQKAPSLLHEPTLSPWLHQAAKFVAANLLRAKTRRTRHESEAAAMMPATSAPPQWHQIEPDLEPALDRLPFRDRQILLLRFYEQQSHPEIAVTLRISESAAAKRLERALERLRVLLIPASETSPLSSAAISSLLLAHIVAPAPVARAAATAATTSLATGALTAMALAKLQTAALLTAACLLILLLSAGSYFALHHGTAPASAVVTPTLTPIATSSPPTTITLTGTVKDVAGNPIDHAFVSQGWSPFDPPTFHSTYTDADGNFTLTHIKPGDNLLLTATAQGFSPQVLQSGKLLADPAPAAFSLAPGHTLKLHFIDQRGNPIENVLAEPISWQNKDVLRSEYTVKNSRAAMQPFMSDANGDITWNSAPADPVGFGYSQFVEHSPYRRGDSTVTAGGAPLTITLKDALKITATVVDAKTRQPIPDFNFFIGCGDADSKPSAWYPEPHHGEDGAFLYTDDEFDKFAFIRVEAPGYPPAVQSVLGDHSPVTLSFRLSAAAALHLTVLTPDKQPADSVKVYTATVPAYFDFENDAVRDGVSPSEPPFQTTDADGHCLLADPGKTPARILVLAPDGYAERLPADLRANPTITLEPWASLTLHIHDGSTPLAHSLISIHYSAPETPQAPSLTISLQAKTSASGDISFLRLPPRPLSIRYQFMANENTPYGDYADVLLKTLTPIADQSLDIPLPDNGQSVSGKLVNLDGSPLPTPSIFSMGYIQPPGPPPLLTPAETKEVSQLSPDDRKKWWVNLWKQNPQRVADHSKMVSAYFAAHSPAAPVLIHADGSFRATNLLPGDYVLKVSLLNPATGKPALTLSHPLTIPSTPTALDLGNLPLERLPRNTK